MKELLWLPSYSSFRKIEIKAKSFPRGAVNNMLWFIYHFCPSLLRVFMAVMRRLTTLSGHKLRFLLLDSRFGKLSPPSRDEIFTEMVLWPCFPLTLSRDAHLCMRCQWRPTDGMVTSSICSRFPSSVFICTRKEPRESRSSQRQTCKMFFVPQSSNFNHWANQTTGSPLLT